ncbi:hypothetical protein QBB34_21290 [Streptomyces stelliscabiei]|uniref:hypothetical protein n=1 Tax=Streptomyces stelliscabiei TaxID=146820 RepID=UPI002FEFF94E
MMQETTARERDPFLEAVGRVTVAGAQLDSYLHNLLGILTMEPTLIRVASAEGTARLIEFCGIALTNDTIEPRDVAEIKACLNRARDLKDKRNTVVHSLYSRAEDGSSFEAMKPRRRKLSHSVSTITVAEMEATADGITELCQELFRVGWNARAAKSGMDRIPPPGAPADASA